MTATNGVEVGVIKEDAGEDGFGEDADAGVRGVAFFEADVVADFVADLPVVFVGDALSRSAGGDAAGLEHDEVRGGTGEDVGADECGRDAGCFARARRGNEDDRGVGAERDDEFGERGVDGERDHGGEYRDSRLGNVICCVRLSGLPRRYWRPQLEAPRLRWVSAGAFESLPWSLRRRSSAARRR